MHSLIFLRRPSQEGLYTNLLKYYRVAVEQFLMQIAHVAHWLPRWMKTTTEYGESKWRKQD